jgi:hypothetical protein
MDEVTNQSSTDGDGSCPPLVGDSAADSRVHGSRATPSEHAVRVLTDVDAEMAAAISSERSLCQNRW